MVKIDPWGSELVKNYTKYIKDFGMEEFHIEMFPKPNRLMRRNVVFGGRDLKRIVACIKNKKKFYVLSGIMPTAKKIHFGTKCVIENIRYFQDHGATTYLLIADLEASATRGISLEEARKRAMEFHIPSYIALGLDPKKTFFYFQSENKTVSNMGFIFSQKITLNTFRGIYGNADPSRIMSAVLQCGDMLFPQEKKKMPGIIPVGPDQDPHIRLCRDLVPKFKDKYVQLSSIYHKYTPSLDGKLKMSKSCPMGNLEILEDPKIAKKKINRALTGGRDTLEQHRKLGGQPEKCMVFELLKQHLIEDDKKLDKIYKDYKSGKLTSGEIKQIAIKEFTKFMKDFNSKLKKARKTKVKFIK